KMRAYTQEEHCNESRTVSKVSAPRLLRAGPVSLEPRWTAALATSLPWVMIGIASIVGGRAQPARRAGTKCAG
ncbi:MAG: hypothetical protein ACMG6S_27725, partial [Byssovorax sp.]